MSWPPPDPDRITRKFARPDAPSPYTYDEGASEQARIEAFRQRQQQDMQRWQNSDTNETVRKRKVFHKRFDEGDGDANGPSKTPPASDESGEEGWRNSEGERLKDFGVDEEVEFYDEDNVPLATLIGLRKAATSA